MFNRFFKNKDDAASKAGHRSSQSGQGGNGAAAPDENIGGGFFNLPPTVAKHPYGSASPAPGVGGGAPIVPSAGGAAHASGPATYSRPTAHLGSYHTQQQPAPPAAQPHHASYGHSTSYEAPSGGQSAPPAPGGLDMFGGMSIKNPSGATASSSSSTYAHSAGYSSSAVPAYTGAPSQPAGVSMFNGLDLAGGGGLAAAPAAMHDDHGHLGPPGGMGDRRKSGTRTTGSFNYLDVAANTTLADAASQHSRTSSNASGGARSVPKVVKKKKTKSFRPGFGRQLSDESIAALQRGDLKEEDVVHATTAAGAEEPARPAVNPTDLAHLLPPVGGGAGSMLAGLTVHKAPAPAASTSVLAGLTVHTPAAVPTKDETSAGDSADAQNNNNNGGGVLAGLNVHASKPSARGRDKRESSDSEASTSVVPATSAANETRSDDAPAKRSSAPPAPLTPEERLLATLRDFHASAVSFRDTVLKHNDEEHRLLERKSYLANQLAQYEIDLRDVEAQQHHACEVEDFERADALNATINSVRHCITLSESDVRKAESDFAAFVKAKERAFANQLRSTRGTLRELEKFRDDQEAERASTRAAAQAFEMHETEQLQFEAERIDTEMHHVSASLEHLAAEKAEIDATIADQCKDEVAVQTELLAERAVVDAEVQELERQLALKRARVVAIDASIAKAEHEIDVVRSRYARQLKRIADREAGIHQTKREVESDMTQLTQQQRAFADQLAAYDASVTTCAKRISTVRREMRAATLLASVLEVQETRREQSLVRKKQQTAELSTLSDAAAIAEQSYVMLQTQHDELVKSLAIHQNAIASAEAMIPRLEHEKKAAAAQRNFKDAARISKDIKALEKDRATAEEMVEVVEMELQDMKERIAKRRVEFEDKQRERDALEKQLELVLVGELWKEAAHLRTALRKLTKCTSDGAAADEGVDVRTSALLLVQAELDACALQIHALETKYDVSDPNKDDDAVESDDDDGELDTDDDDEQDVPRRTSAAASGADATPTAACERHDVDVDAIGESASALDDIAAKLSELEGLIDEATENEEYELAARLDEKIESLKRRQHSLVALAARETPSQDAAADESDRESDRGEDNEDSAGAAAVAEDAAAQAEPVDAHEHAHGHDAQTIDELTDELAALRERIIQVEDDIDLATQQEEYESAAAFDEELQELRAEQEEIQRLLDAARAAAASHTSASSRSDASDAPVAAPTSLFTGLGVKQPSGESESGAAAPAPLPSMFGGLTVAAPVRKSSSHSSVTEGDSSLFGGLELSGATASPRKLSISSSPIEPAALAHDSTAAAVALPTALDSPTASRVTGVDSFFGGLQVGGTAAVAATVSTSSETVHYPSPASSASASMFGGLQLSQAVESVATAATSASVFNGLTISHAVSDLGVEPHDATLDANGDGDDASASAETSALPAPDTALEQPTLAVATATEAQTAALSTDATAATAMFASLHVSVSSSAGHETQSRSGSSSSLVGDEHSTDSPMTIHELSDHTIATDDEDGSLSGSLVGHDASSFSDISFTSTALTTLTTTTTVTTTTTTGAADSSLFGGLSLMQPAPVDATHSSSTTTTGDTGDEEPKATPTEL